jgi:tetratricopeptide (TPR) repeat protein
LDAAKDAQAEDDDATYAWSILAEVRELNHDRGAAIEAARRASASNDPWTVHSAGVVLIDTGEINPARALSVRLANEKGRQAHLMAKLLDGEILRAQKKYEEAVKAFGEAQAMNDTWMVHLELARVYQEAGDLGRARVELTALANRRGAGAFAHVNSSRPTLRYVAQAAARLAQLEQAR